MSLAYGRSRVKAVRASGINSRDYRIHHNWTQGLVLLLFVWFFFFLLNEFPTLALFFQSPELTTWFKVMTRSRVSLQLFTRASGKQGSMSFSSVSMCSVVVASREPGRQRGVLVLILLCCPHFPPPTLGLTTSPPDFSISWMQNLAVETAAGWWAGAFSPNMKSLPLRTEHTPC